jgi:DNA-directed RNA polymerase subunit RPC12/RpoP
MIRNLTDDERAFIYRDYCCSFCGATLVDGPQGGGGINMLCSACGAIFNLIHRRYKERYGEQISFFGQLIEPPTRPYTPRS